MNFLPAYPMLLCCRMLQILSTGLLGLAILSANAEKLLLGKYVGKIHLGLPDLLKFLD